ncbi:MAG TPA: hypothetical protein VIM07_15115 [Chitinophagaceae bacterium]
MDNVYTKEVTKRFLEASETIMADKRLSQSAYAKSIGTTPANFARMKANPGENNVSIERLCEMIHQYGISPIWSITGHGDKYADPVKVAAKEILKSRIIGMELVVDDIKQALKILKKSAK